MSTPEPDEPATGATPYSPPASPVVSPPGTPDTGSAILGAVLAVGALVLLVPVALVGMALASMVMPEPSLFAYGVFLCFGFAQWVYLVPIGIWLRRRGKPQTALGLWIMGAVMCLLNSACFGLLLMMPMNFR